MNNNDFIYYLENNGYYFNKEVLENFLLSLKVKPFIILTGTPGTGKTKLPQLFARYIDWNDNDYYMIKVSTLKRSFLGGKDSRVGWGIYKEYLDLALPIDKINGKYDVEIGGITTQANFSLGIILYYDHENEALKNYFKKLYDKELLTKKSNKKQDQQMVYLGVSHDSLKQFISEDYISKKEIILRPTLTESAIKGKEKLVPFEIYEYMPFNKKIPCTVTANGLFANAHFEVKVRMRNYTTDEIKRYLKTLKDNGETHFELKIKGFEHNFKDFKLFSSELFEKINYVVMPVGADWNDGSHIVGYYNAITNKYQSTPSNELIELAHKVQNYPYFLILDEMNMSNIEGYFSDFLSAMETGGEIPLYGNDDTLKLPKNLFVIGTVNVDKNNHIFLPKILDRCNVIELDTLFASEYMVSELIENKFEGNISYLQSPLMDSDISLFNIHDLKEVLSGIMYNGDNLWDILSNEISEFQKILKGSSFEFSYRVFNEILRFMVVAWRYENSPTVWNNWKRYFDAQIKQRIIPKLHGSENEIGSIVIDLFNLCLNERNNPENPNSFHIVKDNCKYYTSALKLQKMSQEFSDHNYVSFIS